jgi:Family of unknown function (DUF6502)
MKPKKKLKETDRLLRQALVGLLRLKLQSDAAVDDLRALVAECVDLAVNDSALSNMKKTLDIHRLASVLRAWHKETRYLSSDGKPMPLQLKGKVGLQRLISTYYPGANIALAFEMLKRADLIKRHTRTSWVPTQGYVSISVGSQETLDHVTEGVSRFLETVQNNVNSRAKSQLLFEQSCKVHRLPTTKAAEFRTFVRQQAIAFLTAVDDWLEARVESATLGRAKEKACTAGVFTFAYIDPAKKSRRPEQRKS